MKVILAEDKWTLRELENERDALKYGKGSGWCTAEPGNPHYKRNYSQSSGKLYTIHAQYKKGKGQRPKYQIFQSWENRVELRGRGNTTSSWQHLIEEFGKPLEEWLIKELGIVFTKYEHPVRGELGRMRGVTFTQHGRADQLWSAIARHFAELGIRFRWAEDIAAHGIRLHVQMSILGTLYEADQIVDHRVLEGRSEEMLREVVRSLEARMARTYEMMTNDSFGRRRYLATITDRGEWGPFRNDLTTDEVAEVRNLMEERQAMSHEARLEEQRRHYLEEMRRRTDRHRQIW